MVQHAQSHLLIAFAEEQTVSANGGDPFDITSSVVSSFATERFSRIIVNIKPPITIGHSRKRAVDEAIQEGPVENSVVMAINGAPMHTIILMPEYPRCFPRFDVWTGAELRSACARNPDGRWDISSSTKVQFERHGVNQ